MRVCIDIETDALVNPTKIWCIVCKDIDTGKYYIFRNVLDDPKELAAFVTFAGAVTLFIGHNLLQFDIPVLITLTGPECTAILQRILLEMLVVDTFILSKLVAYSRKGHSIESYGIEFSFPKGDNFIPDFFKKWSQELEDYCKRDVDICELIYRLYINANTNYNSPKGLELEQQFQLIANDLQTNGFSFNVPKAEKLLAKVTEELEKLDVEIEKAFPSRLRLVKEIHPRTTIHGTLNKGDFRWVKGGDLSEFNGGPFSRCSWQPFNPASHRQVIEILHTAGWAPVDRTETHKDVLQAINRARYQKKDERQVDLVSLRSKLKGLEKYGWKISENNLSTLSSSAPSSARTLAKRILLESRRRTLVEWLSLVCIEIRIKKESLGTVGITRNEIQTQLGVPNVERTKDESTVSGLKNNVKSATSKIEEITSNVLTDSLSKNSIKWLHSKKVNVQFVKENANYLWITITGQAQLEVFYAILATGVLDGLKPSLLQFTITSERIHGTFQVLGTWTGRMAHQKPNTANIPNEYKEDGSKKLLGKELRSLWQAPSQHLLAGVDAESIQLRIFAHIIDDKELINRIVNGKKSDKTDPHSFNQQILRCKTRQAAKRFLYALFLGGGIERLAQILEVDRQAAEAALNRLIERYPGFDYCRREIIPSDAKRGYFIGLDGREVPIPGDTVGERRHLAMSGYLQNGEAVIMKAATCRWYPKLELKYPSYISKDGNLTNQWKLVALVHDEWQIEVPNNMEVAWDICSTVSASLVETGEALGLKCPMQGSYFNDDKKDYTIATNWASTH